MTTKVEFAHHRVVGNCVFADHDVLPSIEVTRFLTRESVDALMEAEAERQRQERRQELRRWREEDIGLLDEHGLDESLEMLEQIPGGSHANS